MRRGMTRGGGLVSAVLGLVLVLSACTTSAEVETEPTSRTVVPTVEPTPTPTPTPTPDIAPEAAKPERPEAMEEVSPAGAEAVARHFLDLYVYVYDTNDLVAWQELSHPECIFCRSVSDDITASAELGETSTGGSIVIERVVTTEVTPGAWYAVEVEGQQLPWTAFDAAGVVIGEQEKAEEHTFHIVVVREGDRWLVRGVQVDDAPE